MKKEFIVNRQGKDFVLYAGLLDQAHTEGLKRISTTLVQAPTPENGQMAICHAEVETEKGIFCGIGDANPDNVGRMIAMHCIRMAETRAKARALRDAINVGVTAFEELGDFEEEERYQPKRERTPRKDAAPAAKQPAAPPPARDYPNVSAFMDEANGTPPAGIRLITLEQQTELTELQDALGLDRVASRDWSFVYAQQRIDELKARGDAQDRLESMAPKGGLPAPERMIKSIIDLARLLEVDVDTTDMSTAEAAALHNQLIKDKQSRAANP